LGSDFSPKLLEIDQDNLGTTQQNIVSFFAKHSLDSTSPEIVDRHALSYVLVQVTVNAALVRVKLVRVTDNP